MWLLLNGAVDFALIIIAIILTLQIGYFFFVFVPRTLFVDLPRGAMRWQVKRNDRKAEAARWAAFKRANGLDK